MAQITQLNSFYYILLNEETSEFKAVTKNDSYKNLYEFCTFMVYFNS